MEPNLDVRGEGQEYRRRQKQHGANQATGFYQNQRDQQPNRAAQQQDKDPMDPSQPSSLYLRSTTLVSLNERFSKVLRSQLIRVTPDPGSLQLRRRPRRLVLSQALLLSQRRKLRRRRRRRRGSIWTRLGGLHLSYCRLPGFWSFRNKYTWRARSSAPYRRGRDLPVHLERTVNLPTQAAGRRRLNPTLRRGGAMATKGRGFSRKYVPTKKQLDAQLDEYMSLSRRRLDEQLEDYMSRSRRRLDEELDEYMLMAGESLED